MDISDFRMVHSVICKLHSFVTYWIIVAVTGERVMAVYFPHKIQVWTTRKKTWMYIGLVTLVMALINCHWFFSVTVMHDDFFGTACDAPHQSWYHFIWYIFPYIDFVVFAGCPFTFLILGNILIIIRIIYAKRLAEQNLNVTAQNPNQISQMTVILLGISTMFILLNGPICFWILVLMVWLDTSRDIHKEAQLTFSYNFCNMLMYANNTLNFWIYCATGSRFRRELLSLFCKKTTLLEETTKTSKMSDMSKSTEG